jgi:hypothetical protein
MEDLKEIGIPGNNIKDEEGFTLNPTENESTNLIN